MSLSHHVRAICVQQFNTDSECISAASEATQPILTDLCPVDLCGEAGPKEVVKWEPVEFTSVQQFQIGLCTGKWPLC